MRPTAKMTTNQASAWRPPGHLREKKIGEDWKRMRVLVGHGDSGLDLIDLEAATTLRSLQGHSCLIATICVSWPKNVAAGSRLRS